MSLRDTDASVDSDGRAKPRLLCRLRSNPRHLHKSWLIVKLKVGFEHKIYHAKSDCGERKDSRIFVFDRTASKTITDHLSSFPLYFGLKMYTNNPRTAEVETRQDEYAPKSIRWKKKDRYETSGLKRNLVSHSSEPIKHWVLIWWRLNKSFF